MATEAPPRPGAVIDSSSDDDDAPLATRVPAPPAAPSAPPANQNANGSSAPVATQPAPVAKPAAPPKVDSDSEDDRPLAARQKAVVPQPAAAVPKKKPVFLDDAEELLPAPKPKPKPAPKPVVAPKPEESSDSEDDVPLAQRKIQSSAPGTSMKLYF
jgi:hypothetical protein